MQLEIVSLALLSSVTVVALTGRMLSSDIIGYLGVRYGRAPVRTYRFEKSIPLHLNESEIFDQWPKRCPSLLYELELDEDCLFFSLLQHNSVKYRAATLLIVTNDNLVESKLLGIVSSTLNVIVASVRDGVLGSLGDSPFSVSDVISLSIFLQSHSNILNIGPITVCAVGSIAETISASLPQIDFARAILFNGNSHTRTKGRRKYSSRALYKLKTELMCDLPSVSQSTDCLRSKSLNEILSATNKVTVSISDNQNVINFNVLNNLVRI
uniref:COesterase domain-containing protein n=1 Tax=Heterorhabditis bacteriophora TaxID=37862 RepID=A0A1I7WBW4_HETBA